MTRHYRIQRPAAKDAQREAYAKAHPEDVRPPDPGDCRDEGYIRASWGGVTIDWVLKPRRGNVRQLGAFERATGEPVYVDGKHLVGGKDVAMREAAKMLPKFSGLGRW
jgi:hypothetical protein